MQTQRWIARLLYAGGWLVLGGLVFAALWGLLTLTGDAAGATAARLATLLLGVLSGLVVLGLVVLLAYDRLADKIE